MTRAPFIFIAAMLNPAFGAASAAPVGDQARPLWLIPLDSLTASRDKPLFSPTRRPPPPPYVAPPAPPQFTAPVAAPPDPPPPATLVGVLLGPNGLSVAILQETNATGVKRLRVGEAFKNWKLSELRPNQAVFVNAGQTATLQLNKPSAEKSAGANHAPPRARFPNAPVPGAPMPFPEMAPPMQNFGGPGGQPPFPPGARTPIQMPGPPPGQVTGGAMPKPIMP